MRGILGCAVAVVGLFALACAPAQPAAPAAPAPPAPAAKPAQPAAPAPAPKPAQPAAAKPAPAAPAAPAQPAKPATPGAWTPDLQLLEAAKKEGKVIWYSGFTPQLVERVAREFKARTGLEVESTRLSAGPIYDRLMRERQAGLNVVDVIVHGDMALWLDYRKRAMLERSTSREAERIRPEVRDPDGLFYAAQIAPGPIVYNSRSVSASDAPRRYGDAADAKYKGKTGMPDPRYSGVTAELVFTLEKLYGWSYFEKLKANTIRLFRSAQELLPVNASGEVPVGIGAAFGPSLAAKQKGSPLEIVLPAEGLHVPYVPAGLLKSAPHPNAGRLLFDFIFSTDVQKLVSAEGYYSGRDDVPPPGGMPPLRDLKLLTADVVEFVQVAKEQKERWAELFGG